MASSARFASVTGVNGSGGLQNKSISTKSFWEFTTPEINLWIRRLAPGVPNTGGMLFPKTSPATKRTPEQTKKGTAQAAIGNVLVQNLTRALSSASSHKGASSDASNPAKRPKMDPLVSQAKGDLYQILDPSFAKSRGSAGSELSTGAILSRITLGGLVNALAGVEGGVVDTLTVVPLASSSLAAGNVDEDAKKEETKKRMEEVVASAAGLPLKEVVRLARGLHRSVAAR